MVPLQPKTRRFKLAPVVTERISKLAQDRLALKATCQTMA
jgi:hypothetical protein